MTTVAESYALHCAEWSDIYEHLPTLKTYAEKCDSVLETGVRGCVSSWAFVHGLLCNENGVKKRICLNDISPCDIAKLLDQTRDEPNLEVTYQWCNNLELEFPENETFDLTFIDTWHVYAQLKRELRKFAPITRKYIIMHDTTVDAIQGETVRERLNAEEQSRQTGFPLEEINRGLSYAITEFLEEHPEWEVLETFTHCNGLTVLHRV